MKLLSVISIVSGMRMNAKVCITVEQASTFFRNWRSRSIGVAPANVPEAVAYLEARQLVRGNHFVFVDRVSVLFLIVSNNQYKSVAVGDLVT